MDELNIPLLGQLFIKTQVLVFLFTFSHLHSRPGVQIKDSGDHIRNRVTPLNFLAQFWEPAQSASFLSVLNYYTPLLILRDSGWPVGDMAVLVGCAVVFWVAGGIVFARRDICTV